MGRKITSAKISGILVGLSSAFSLLFAFQNDRELEVQDVFLSYTQDQGMVIELLSIKPVSCSGERDGAIDVSVSGGTGTYQYAWSGAGVSYGTSEDAEQLPAGTYELTVTDTEGNSGSESFEVLVEDKTPPAISPPPAKSVNTTLDGTGNCTTRIDLGIPVTSDNCGISSTKAYVEGVEIDPASFYFPVGTTLVTWESVDDSGNRSSATQEITVEDNELPEITPPADRTVNTDLDGTGNCTTRIDLGTPVPSDNCGIDSTKAYAEGAEIDPASYNFPVGTTLVTWESVDNSGNRSSATQEIVVEDNELPEITPPADRSVTTDLDGAGNCTTRIDIGTPVTSDNCGISSTKAYVEGAEIDPASYEFSVGTTLVIWESVDYADNRSSSTQEIVVEDNEAPVPTALEPLVWSCNESIPTPTATDNCAGELTGTTPDPLSFSVPGEYTVLWSFEDGKGNSISREQEISIPNPTVIDPASQASWRESFCNEEQVPEILFSGNEFTTGFRWTNDNPSIGLPGNGTGNIPSFTATNVTDQTETATITVIPLSETCEGRDPQSFTIRVFPTATFTQISDIFVCAEESISRIDLPGASVEGTSFTWVYTDHDPGLNIGLAPSGEAQVSSNGVHFIPGFEAENPSAETLSAKIRVTPFANGCEGIPLDFSINVHPLPKLTEAKAAELASGAVFCSGISTGEVPLGSDTAAVVYDIAGGASIGLSDRTGVKAIPGFTPVNNSSAPITVPVRITPRANGCTGIPIEYIITVNPSVGISVAPAAQRICSGETTGISLSNAVPGTSFSWTVTEITGGIEEFTEGVQGSGARIEEVITNSSSTVEAVVRFRVVPTANGCEGSPIFVTITVDPTPELEISAPDSCFLDTFDLTTPGITSGPGLDLSYWFDEAATDQIPDPTTVGPGTFFIKGVSAAGCYSIKPVTVSETRLIPVLTSPQQTSGFCSGSAFQYELSSSIPGTSFSWIRLANENIETPVQENGVSSDIINEVIALESEVRNSIAVEYEVTLVSPDGCVNIQTITTTVTPTPRLSSSLLSEPVCSNTPFRYTPESETSGTTFSWSRQAVPGISNPATTGTGNIEEVLVNTTTQPVTVTYVFNLTSNNCQNPTTYNVTVNVIPSPDTQVSASKMGGQPVEELLEICAGEGIDLFSSTSFADNLPPVILNSDFNSGNQGWTLSSGTNGRKWALTQDGQLAFSRTYCYWTRDGGDWERICREQEAFFHSNDNSRFFLVSSYNNDRDFDNINLTSPSFSTLGYESVELSFWHHYKDNGSSWRSQEDIGVLEVSINNGAWAELESYTSQVGDSHDFRKETIYSLPSGQENVRIRFRYHDARDDWYWAIDNVRITGEGSNSPQVSWTSDVGGFTSTEPNPKNVRPQETTIYTATYNDPDTNCPGSASVKVVIRDTPNPPISADYCGGNSGSIILTSLNPYATYLWESSGEVFGHGQTVEVETAGTYILTVTDEFGCEGTSSINVSEELIINGDFEDGATGFITEYRNRTGSGDLYPEGDYAVDEDAGDYHNNFFGRDHTTGDGNFMIVNGHPDEGKVVWEQTIHNLQPNTAYYFNAWGMNLNTVRPAKLQFRVNGQPTGTVADLTNEPAGKWIQFYSNPFWNSGENTSVTLEIINTDITQNGNDFGLDDISFGTLERIKFEIAPTSNSALCEGETLRLFSNIEGGRDPINFSWANEAGEVVSTEEDPEIENVTVEDAGTYTLTVTDFYGCEAISSTTEVRIVRVDAGEDLEVCAEDPVVQLNASVTGSTAQITWSGGNGSFDDRNALNAVYTPSAEEIAQGSVSLHLETSDPDLASSCGDELVISINPTPVISMEATHVSCYGGSDGTAGVSIISGGTAPFSYQWSDAAAQTTQKAVGLKAGTYSVTVTDAAGCAATLEDIQVLEPTPLIILGTSFTGPLCHEGNNGTASIELQGGYIETLSDRLPSYTIVLTNSKGDEVARADNYSETIFETSEILSAGNYVFTVSAGEACSSTAVSISLTQPDPVAVDPGEDQSIASCGVITTFLAAGPVDDALGSGEWSILSGQGGHITEPSDPASRFEGKAGETYTLQWTVSLLNGCATTPGEVQIRFPEACSQLDFDGVDDYISFGNEFSFTAPFSVEAWVKPHSTPGQQTILSRRDMNDLSKGYDLILNHGLPAFRINNATISSTFPLKDKKWHHIAATYDGERVLLYVDGVLVKTSSGISSPVVPEAPFLIGAMHNSLEPEIPVAHFHGWIEEVRLWQRAVSEEQIRFLMNQRIMVSARPEAPITGEVLPMQAPGSSMWQDLVGYYPLIPAEVSNGSTPDRSSSAIDGSLYNITTRQENTAPLPYYTDKDGEWFNTNNNSPWKYGNSVWYAPYTTGIDGKTLIEWNITEINNSIRSGKKDITVLAALVSAGGKMDMEGSIPPNLSGNGLTVTHYLDLEGVVDLNGGSQLVQPEGSLLAEEGSGHLEIDQQGTASSYHYNYWTSPVRTSSIPGDSTYTIAGVMKDGTDPAIALPINFNYQYHFADGPQASPIKISSYWLYSFFGKAGMYSQWRHTGEHGKLLAGEGFSMKGSSGQSKIPDLQNYTFTGYPNNGNVSLRIHEDQNYLIGNPYPSAIDADEFIKDNLAQRRNGTNVFNGALYFWDHFSGKTHYLEEYIGGYAVYNLSGGVRAVASDERINNGTDNGNYKRGQRIPQQYIPVGQAFFVNTTLDEALSDFDPSLSIDGGYIHFRNRQREFQMEAPNSSVFHSQEPSPGKIGKEEKQDKRIRIWLEFQSPTGYHRQLLLTADKETTNGFDLGYDALLNDDVSEDLYWSFNGGRFVIQGVPHLNRDQVLPIGMKIAKDIEFTIKIDDLQNVPEQMEIYLEDKLHEVVHDLRAGAYSSASEPGTLNGRFQLVFQKEDTPPGEEEGEQGGDGPGENENPGGKLPPEGLDFYYVRDTREIVIHNPQLIPIYSTRLMNVLGQQVWDYGDIEEAKILNLPVPDVATGVYFLSLSSKEGDALKKIVIE